MKIDDQTWNDLLLDAYCERVGGAASLFGRESLRDRLRYGGAADGTHGTAATRERVAALMSDGALAGTVSAARRPLSACDASVAMLLADPDAVARAATASVTAPPAVAAHAAAGAAAPPPAAAASIAAPSVVAAASVTAPPAVAAHAGAGAAAPPPAAAASVVAPPAVAAHATTAAANASVAAHAAAGAAASAAAVFASATASAAARADTPRWSRHLWLLPAAFLLSAVLALVWWPLWPVALASWLLLMAVQVTYHGRMQIWQSHVHSLQAMLHTHASLAAIPSPLLDTFRPQAQAAKKLSRQLSRSILTKTPVVSEYLDWILLDNLKHYFHTQRLVAAHAATLRQSYTLVAGMDADLAIALHLPSTRNFCWAEQANAISLQQVVHPLLENPQPLSIALKGGAFISGQNGIGKSTLLRTIGINLLTARAFGFCYAEQASVPFTPVCASMKSEDALEQGESLYLAELRRAKEMLALAGSGQRTVFMIDEIFRGTNHLESVSAGAAVLHTLAEKDIVLVSSHNLVLGTLLNEQLQAICVQAEEGGLRLEPGILRQTNGLSLLRNGDFDPAIEARAQEVYARLVDMASA